MTKSIAFHIKKYYNKPRFEKKQEKMYATRKRKHHFPYPLGKNR